MILFEQYVMLLTTTTVTFILSFICLYLKNKNYERIPESGV